MDGLPFLQILHEHYRHRYQVKWEQLVSILVDDLAYRLSRFLIFLSVSQDSFAIPSIQDSRLKK
jgi:hypothetical protein